MAVDGHAAFMAERPNAFRDELARALVVIDDEYVEWLRCGAAERSFPCSSAFRVGAGLT
jgi:hypothetical protein